jgi:hypothetical protein
MNIIDNSELTIIDDNDNKLNKKSNIFTIPKYNEFDNIYNKKYTIVNLKIICKHYKIKSTGTKPELLERIFKYLKETFYVIKIQRLVKKYFIKALNYYKGPGLIKRKLCVNDTDFMSMDSINDISYYQFISYKDNDNYIYGFDLISLYNWISTSIKDDKNKDILNPYNRNKFPCELIKNLRIIIRLSKVLKFDIDISLNNSDLKSLSNSNISISEINNNMIVRLFQNMDELGFYTDISWFNELNYYTLIRYVKELYDIWTYRAQLSYETKYMICQSYDPFMNCMYIINQNRYYSSSIDINTLKYSILIIIDRMINSGSTREYKYLGASYVLAALTLVSSNAANSIPWLYQSVA